MSRRMDESTVAQILKGRKSPFEFCESRRLITSRIPVTVFQIRLEGCVRAHLYLDPTDYSIVWNGTERFQPTQPFMFVDLQFSNIPSNELKMLDNVLPKKKRDRLHYYHDQCKAILQLNNEEDVREYDLLNQDQQDAYVGEILSEGSALANVVFARYDSIIVDQHAQTQFYTGFTAERASDDAPTWEFAVKVPRSLLLKERVLTWIAKSPSLIAQDQRVDFKGSLNSLHRLVAI